MIQFDAQFGEYSGVHVSAPSRVMRDLVWGVLLWAVIAMCGTLLRAQARNPAARQPPDRA